MAREYRGIDVDPLTPAIGAVIAGVDLSAPIDDATADAIHQALIEYLVVFFHDQDLTPEHHLAFAARFGELEPPHPILSGLEGHERILVLETEAKSQLANNEWHADMTFRAEPPFGSILHAKALPRCGGDTLWANMYAAYEALSEPIRRMLSGLAAVHDMGPTFRSYLGTQGDGGERLRRAEAAIRSVEHPVVKRHPVTGRALLFVNQTFTSHIVGMERRESDAILGMLYRHVERPEFQVRFRWRVNDVAFWDNRATQHYAVADYFPQQRRMQRVTLLNDSRETRRAA